MVSIGKASSSKSEYAQPSNTASNERPQNYYEILKLERNATEKEIKNAYRKLALIYHPDRNPGDLDAQESFKKIATAYSVLSDPNKKRQFDTLGPAMVNANGGELDISHTGKLGRFCFMLCAKIGLPIQTSIIPDVLVRGEELCADSEKAFFAFQLGYQKPMEGKVGRQKANFYRLSVCDEMADAGVIIHCKSSSVDRFKLVLFDKEGAIRNISESEAKKDCSVAELYFVPFTKITVKKLSVIAAVMSDRTVPYEFHLLDTLEIQGAHKLETGEHILCVYGDNFFKSVEYKLDLLLLNSSSKGIIKNITDKEQELINMRKSMAEFKDEYIKVKKAYETEALLNRKHREKEDFDNLRRGYSAFRERLRSESNLVNAMLKEREQYYTQLVDQCRFPNNQAVGQNRKKKCFLPSIFF